MEQERQIQHHFVDYIPDKLEENTLYVSLEFATAIHKCLCGCGNQVVTPFSPTDWRLTFDGSVSLEPSIGNWSFKCRSHYWITQNTARWARAWSEDEISAGRIHDAKRKGLLSNSHKKTDPAVKESPKGLWERLKSWLWVDAS